MNKQNSKTHNLPKITELRKGEGINTSIPTYSLFPLWQVDFDQDKQNLAVKLKLLIVTFNFSWVLEII
jgi:hypothetical protein